MKQYILQEDIVKQNLQTGRQKNIQEIRNVINTISWVMKKRSNLYTITANNFMCSLCAEYCEYIQFHITNARTISFN